MKNKFVIIDEKPKRRYTLQRQAPSRVFVVLMVLVSVTLIMGLGILFAVIARNDSLLLEQTAIFLPVRNETTVAEITETNSAIETYDAGTRAPYNTLAAVNQQQTALAATQNALDTAQAQAIATLTALPISAP